MDAMSSELMLMGVATLILLVFQRDISKICGVCLSFSSVPVLFLKAGPFPLCPSFSSVPILFLFARHFIVCLSFSSVPVPVLFAFLFSCVSASSHLPRLFLTSANYHTQPCDLSETVHPRMYVYFRPCHVAVRVRVFTSGKKVVESCGRDQHPRTPIKDGTSCWLQLPRCLLPLACAKLHTTPVPHKLLFMLLYWNSGVSQTHPIFGAGIGCNLSSHPY